MINHFTQFVECNFVDNVATNGATGGAVALRGNWKGDFSTVDINTDVALIDQCGFWSNTAMATNAIGNRTTGGNGGAVYAFELAFMVITDSYFKDNTQVR